MERAEVLDQKQDEPRLPRTVTVRFMARAIRSGRLLGKSVIFPVFVGPPEISEGLLKTYGSALPDRLKRFNCKVDLHRPGDIYDPSDTIARHALHHDAESVYWVLMWWAVCAAPADKVASYMPKLLWDTLTDIHRDYRPDALQDGDLDPSYAALQSLLNELAFYPESDLHWATEAPFNHPEFLHEAFQRIILNFLVENQNEDFMLLPTSGKP